MVGGLVDGRCFSGRWSVMNFWLGRWSMVFMVGAGGGRWSVSNVVGGRCFPFILVGGRFLFLRMVGGLCLNQYMVGGRWFIVGGLWSVAGRWAVVLYYANLISRTLDQHSCNGWNILDNSLTGKYMNETRS